MKHLKIYFAVLLFSFLGSMAEAQTLSAQEQELYNLIMQYRASIGLPSIPISRCLTYVAQTHANDTKNYPPIGMCGMHSWSSNGPWQAVCYSPEEAAKMRSKPRELTPYSEDGYEVSSSGRDGTTEILNGWKDSPGHNAVIINKNNWANYQWKAIGIGIRGDNNIAHVWFGVEPDNYTGTLPSPHKP
jgi:Cysteine-rich secretory protein family